MSSNETPNSPSAGNASLDDLLDSVQNHLQISTQVSNEEEDIPVLTEVVQSAPTATAIGAEQPLAEPDEVETSLSSNPDSSTAEIIEVATAEVNSMDLDIEFDLAADEFSEPESLATQSLTTQSATEFVDTVTHNESTPDIAAITDSDEFPFSPSTDISDSSDPLDPERSLINLVAETPADDEVIETLEDSSLEELIDRPPQDGLDQIDEIGTSDAESVPVDSPAPIDPTPLNEEILLAETENRESTSDHFNPLSDNNSPESPPDLDLESKVGIDTGAPADMAPVTDSAPIDTPVQAEPEPEPETETETEVLADNEISDGATELPEKPWVETILLANDQVELPDIMEMNLDDLSDPESEPDAAMIADAEAETDSDEELPGDPVNLSSSVEDLSALKHNSSLPGDQNPDNNPQQRLEQIDSLIDQRCQSLAAELKLELRSLLDTLDSEPN